MSTANVQRGLRPAVKLAGFAVVVAAAFGAGAAVGAIAGPVEVTDVVEHEVEHEAPATTLPGHAPSHDGTNPTITEAP